MRKLKRNLVLFLSLALIQGCAHSMGRGEAPEVLVYLVRHAEKVDDGSSDPPLTEAGWERARLLARTLGEAGITHIHSTEFTRTLDTAKPLSESLGLEVAVYGLGNLQGFAEVLRGTPGRHLVVGHSNTTPDLVEAMGGTPGQAIEEMEYDRLYLLVLEGREVRTILLRFGAPWGG